MFSRAGAGCAGAVAIGIYFLTMAWPGVLSGFSHDDLMNITFALRDGWWKILRGNLLFFSTQYRPFGGAFYLSLYDLFGWNSLPFRLVCFTFLAANLVLLARFTKQLTGSIEAGLIAAALLAWHGNFSSLYFGSGNCYDVFAFFFYVACLTFYAGARRRGILRGRELFALAMLHICALNSKEFAATVPLLFLIYELVWHWPGLPRLQDPWRWLSSEGRGVVLTAALSALYTAGKTLGSGSLVSHEAYTPRLSPAAFVSSVVVYLNDVLYKENLITRTYAVWFLVVLIAVPIVLRSRAMAMGAALAMVAPLPVLLVAPRGLPSHYLTLAGVAIWISVLLVRIRSALIARIRPSPFEVRYSQCAAFGCLLAFLVNWHLPNRSFQIREWYRESTPIQQAAQSLQRHPEWWQQPGARILFLSDPFSKDPSSWAVIFISILVSHNPNIQAFRLPDLNPKPDAAALRAYTVRLDWRGDSFVAVQSE